MLDKIEGSNKPDCNVMESKLYGFLIDDDIQFDITKRRLFRFYEDPAEHTIYFKAISLNEIQARLLLLLLVNGRGVAISKNDIMKSVWEENNLSSSSQRLWYTMGGLRKKLFSIGLPNDFVLNIHGAGYIINSLKLSPLFIE